MKIIGGLSAFLLVLMAGGWIAAHITGGMILALIAISWGAILGWMWAQWRASVRQEEKQHGKSRTTRRSADR